MHRAADDIADGYGDERDGSEQYALDRSEDGTRAGDVQQVNEAVFPALHRDIVNAVLFRVCRRFAVVRSEHLFTESAVKICPYEQNN